MVQITNLANDFQNSRRTFLTKTPQDKLATKKIDKAFPRILVHSDLIFFTLTFYRKTLKSTFIVIYYQPSQNSTECLVQTPGIDLLKKNVIKLLSG